MKLWITHPRSGAPDAMLTLAVYSVAVVLVKFFLSDVAFGSLTFGELDAGVIGAILTPTLGAYALRKHKDSPDAITSSEEETTNG